MDVRQNQSLDNIPLEILENIAYHAARDSLVGPPSHLTALAATNSLIHSSLSLDDNNALYARIFEFKFDTSALRRRFSRDELGVNVLARELRHRFMLLKRIRRRDDTLTSSAIERDEDGLRDVLWMAYIMMTEDDGKNVRQLCEYAHIEQWLEEYWFYPRGASLAARAIESSLWPIENERNSLAMWLLWFVLEPEKQVSNRTSLARIIKVLKLIALGAPQYPVCSPHWSFFDPDLFVTDGRPWTYLSDSKQLSAPSLAMPAILSFMALHVMGEITDDGSLLMSISMPRTVSRVFPSQEWDCNWARCLSLGSQRRSDEWSGSFRPGSLEGVWEGLFTYTDFTAYAALVNGAPPPILQGSQVAEHHQTWKLREYHLLKPDAESDTEDDATSPLSGGDPLRAHFSSGTSFVQAPDGIEARETRSSRIVHYHRAWSLDKLEPLARESYVQRVRDIIVAGEGHSAWGQFSLVGRIRPCDGLISMSKSYVDGDRGQWLYRGYLVGDAFGNFSGRWRDTMSPPHVAGYEGCFVMSRRR